MRVEALIVALLDGTFTTKRTQVDVQADIDDATASDYKIVAADGIWIYMQREFADAQPAT